MFATVDNIRNGSGDSDMMDVDEICISPRSPCSEDAAAQKLITVRDGDARAIFRDDMMRSVDGSSLKTSELSCVAHSKSGNALAVGDSAGDIHVFERCDDKSGAKLRETLSFKSHKRDFDYLRSLEIEESINKIVWCPSPNRSSYLLSTNDKTIKLWRLGSACSLPTTFKIPKPSRPAKFLNRTAPPRRPTFRRPLPASQLFQRVRTNLNNNNKGGARSHKERKVYENAHAYHINSLSVSSDGETFLSADDLRVNLWKMNRAGSCFTVVDMKPDSMDTLSEVLTTATFHPYQSHIFAYSTSTGAVKLADMRVSALCDNSVRDFKDTTTVSPNSFFAEILECISDIDFTNNGNQLLLRDYMSLKLWDARMEHRPALVVDIQGYLVPKLRELYMNDLIFDKFKCSISHDDRLLLTGTYGGVACAFERSTGAPVANLDCVKVRSHSLSLFSFVCLSS